MVERKTESHLRFTQTSKRILQSAKQLAEGYGQKHIGVEHILLALTRDSATIAYRLISDKAYVLSMEIESVIREEKAFTNEIGLTSRAKKVIQFGMEEARIAGKVYIDAHHLLFGAIREKEDSISAKLESVGINDKELPEHRTKAERLLKQRDEALQTFLQRIFAEKTDPKKF